MDNISVVVPIFNDEEFLPQCLDSIIEQNYKNLELILVDDGSTDSSGQICDNYALKDKRIKVIHQKNSGVSAARNIALAVATGKWITFIDSDDHIKEEYFIAVDKAEKVDWILLQMEREDNNCIVPILNFKKQKYSKSEFIQEFSLYPHFPGPCGKFFKTEIIKENGLEFNSKLKFGEDAVFNLKYLNFCEQIITTNVSTYIYRNTEDGLSKLHHDVVNDHLLFHEVKKELEKYKKGVFYNKSIFFPLSRYIRILYYDKNISKNQRIKILKGCVEDYYKVVLQIYHDPKIKYFFIVAHLTGIYLMLDFVLSKFHK